MPIGRFARSCRLSVKALRHYDELGLLKPEFVDPGSKYRYYGRDQARDAIMIGMLRSLDLPLAVIRNALAAAPGDLKALVEAETTRIEAEVAARQKTLLSLRHIAQSGGLSPYQIEIREHPKRNVARISGTTDSSRLIPDTTELIYALMDELKRAGVEFLDPVLAINEFSDDTDRIDVHACSGFTAEPTELHRAKLVELPAGSFACLTHTGPYETLGLAHHAAFAWIQERGHEALGPVWEFYANDPAEVPPEELITDVALPLSRGRSDS